MRWSLWLLSFLWCCSFSETPKSPLPEVTTNEPKQENSNENLGRTHWQKPNEVINKLGDINGKTIVDIGAGTGYFTFRLALRGARVIATDIDKNMINLIESFRLNLPQDIQNRIESRLVTEDNAMIKENECDIAVIINTIGYIEKRQAYLTNLHRILKPNGKIMVVDYKGSKLPLGIPNNNPIIEVDEIVAQLKQAGFNEIEIDNTTLDFQYIIIAQ